MKKLQNNFTTPEQAYEIMRLGVNKSTADCWRQSPTSDIFVRCSEELRPDFFEGTTFIPCWSVGRLMEITKICITDKDALTEIFELLRDCTFITRNLCQVFEEYSDVLDFSKLEE